MYLVTGATGNVGSKMVDQLLAMGKKVRVFTRDVDKVAHWGDQVEVAAGDFERADTFERAVAGVEGAFLMNGALNGQAFRKLIDTAKGQGSPRIVFLSSTLADNPDLMIGRLHKERRIRFGSPVYRAGLSVPAASCLIPISGDAQ